MLSLTAITLFVYVFEIDRNGSYELILIQSKEMHPKLEIINKKNERNGHATEMGDAECNMNFIIQLPSSESLCIKKVKNQNENK